MVRPAAAVRTVTRATIATMEIIRENDTGAAVEDVQSKLASLGFLEQSQVTGAFDAQTADALEAFCRAQSIPASREVDDAVWAALLDATFVLGDRTLYLRMPHFHGNDVLQLQNALAALGFPCGDGDGIFGAHTEDAVRKFQTNMGLPTDGIAGAFTYRAIRNLHHSWDGKHGPKAVHMGFARAADVLEQNALCLFGTGEFTRSVAARMSNLALATNPTSKIVSADSLLVPPGEDMLLVHIVLPGQETDNVPRVDFNEDASFALRLRSAIAAATSKPRRIAVELPGVQWEDAGEGRSAQHFAITLLDSFCSALAQ